MSVLLCLPAHLRVSTAASPGRSPTGTRQKFHSTNWWWLLRRVLQHWAGSAAGAGQPVVVEVVDAALLVGRWDSLMQESWSVHFLRGRGAVRALLWTALLAP